MEILRNKDIEYINSIIKERNELKQIYKKQSTEMLFMKRELRKLKNIISKKEKNNPEPNSELNPEPNSEPKPNFESDFFKAKKELNKAKNELKKIKAENKDLQNKYKTIMDENTELKNIIDEIQTVFLSDSDVDNNK